MDKENVLIIGEHDNGALAPITLQLLGAGRKLADALEQKLAIVLSGNDVAGLSNDAIAYGADKVYLAQHPLLDNYQSEIYSMVIGKLCIDVSSDIVLLGQTDMGLDLAPRLVGKLNGGLSMDCIGLAIDPETKLLLQTRPVFGGNAHATFITRNGRPQIATVRQYAMAPADHHDSRHGETVNLEIAINQSAIKTRVIKRIKQDSQGVKLEEARVVITGGHGMGNADNFKKLSELASLLGGAVGATRPACEEGWTSSTCMVGQTGKIVNPDLYIALGVSGAMQHMAGCSNSKCVVAVNNNPDANIFGAAHYGVVADCNVFLSEFINKVRDLKK